MTLCPQLPDQGGAWARTSTFDQQTASSVTKVTEEAQTGSLKGPGNWPRTRPRPGAATSAQTNDQAPSTREERPTKHEEETKRLHQAPHKDVEQDERPRELTLKGVKARERQASTIATQARFHQTLHG